VIACVVVIGSFGVVVFSDGCEVVDVVMGVVVLIAEIVVVIIDGVVSSVVVVFSVVEFPDGSVVG